MNSIWTSIGICQSRRLRPFFLPRAQGRVWCQPVACNPLKESFSGFAGRPMIAHFAQISFPIGPENEGIPRRPPMRHPVGDAMTGGPTFTAVPTRPGRFRQENLPVHRKRRPNQTAKQASARLELDQRQAETTESSELIGKEQANSSKASPFRQQKRCPQVNHARPID